MFVAYTGDGRIATLGEEIQHPRRNIPRAIILTLLVSMAPYGAVGTVAIAALGARRSARRAPSRPRRWGSSPGNSPLQAQRS